MIESLLTSIVFGSISGGAVVWLFKEWMTTRLRESIKHEYSVELEKLRTELIESQNKQSAKWDLKYEACMQALDLADAEISNRTIDLPDGVEIVREPIKTEDVRDCINKLACSCDNAEVLDKFKEIILADSYALDIIVDLRNAVRKELEFSTTEIDTDRSKAYIVRV
jgi:hypothetical protein